MINFIFEKFDTIDSTNDYVERMLAENKYDKDAIVVSKCQTNGHGTNGREFVSSKDVGIYFTFLHFYDDMSELSFITQKVAVAIYNVFKNIFNTELSIKWVNDLYYNNKKVVGILCRNLIKYKAVIMGVGIDLFKNDSIDESIKDIAGFIFNDKYELLDKLNNNKNLSKDSCIYHNIYEEFKTIKFNEKFADNFKDIIIDDKNLWEPDVLTVQIVLNILDLIKIPGLPKLYIEKNIIKDEKIYEDIKLQC